MGRLIDADKLIEKLWKKHKEVEEKCYSYTDADEVKDAICGIVAMIDDTEEDYSVHKAIDEFVKLADECSGYTANCIEHDLSLTVYTIHQIAEQLKAGGIE